MFDVFPVFLLKIIIFLKHISLEVHTCTSHQTYNLNRSLETSDFSIEKKKKLRIFFLSVQSYVTFYFTDIRLDL